MKKVTLRLEPELDLALERLAAQREEPKAEVMRAALRGAVAEGKRPRITAIGMLTGPGDVADDVERHLTATRFGR
jgi:hypothetical protein